jgi:hypothetical protein
MKAKPEDAGRWVKFRSPTRWGCKTAVRKIRTVTDKGGVTVAYGGWPGFIVAPHEIIEIFDER